MVDKNKIKKKVFLMYVDADGEYADQKWDKRAGLGMEGVQ